MKKFIEVHWRELGMILSIAENFENSDFMAHYLIYVYDILY